MPAFLNTKLERLFYGKSHLKYCVYISTVNSKLTTSLRWFINIITEKEENIDINNFELIWKLTAFLFLSQWY